MNKKYFHEIDGLRFYAFLLILINHTGLNKTVEGHTFFFTLSGFLIGHTSIYGIKRKGYFLFAEFIKKRILRTFPLYFLIVIGSGILYLVLKSFGKSISFDNYWSFFVFLQNYFGYGTIFILTNLWAMAVTEQLYLIWGLLSKGLGPKLIPTTLPLSLIVIGGIFFLEFYIPSIYTSTLNYAGVYLLGAYCSTLQFAKQSKLRDFFVSLGRNYSIVIFCGALGIIIYGFGFTLNGFAYLFRVHILAIGFCIILLLCCYSNLPFKNLFNNQLIMYLGKISYGLYCFHAIVLTMVTQYFIRIEFNPNLYIIFLITLVLTIGAAILSYEFFEKKFIKKKSNLDFNIDDNKSFNKRKASIL